MSLILRFLRPKTRNISTTCRHRMPATLPELKKLQADYQCEDGQPIYLKAGFRDRVLYMATIISCYVGVFGTLMTIYDHAKPASWREKK